jgi:hypothetical protein
LQCGKQRSRCGVNRTGVMREGPHSTAKCRRRASKQRIRASRRSCENACRERSGKVLDWRLLG